jgi:hypothetical protein
MVQFKDNAIVITIENVNPLEDWQELMTTIADVQMILMSNPDYKVSEYRLNMFNEFHKATCTLSKDSATMKILAKHSADQSNV